MVLKSEDHRLTLKAKDADNMLLELTLSKQLEGEWDITVRHANGDLKTIKIEQSELAALAESIYFFI